MKILVAFAIFIVLFEGIDLYPSNLFTSYSISSPSRFFISTDVDDDFVSKSKFSSADWFDHADFDDSHVDYEVFTRDIDRLCPKIKKISRCIGSIGTSCVDGKFFINGKEIKEIRPTDSVDIIEDELRVNGRVILKIPPSESHHYVISNSFNNYGKFKYHKEYAHDSDNFDEEVKEDDEHRDKKEKDEKHRDKKKEEEDDDDDDDEDEDDREKDEDDDRKEDDKRKKKEKKKRKQKRNNHYRRAIKRSPRVTKNFSDRVETYMKNGKFYINNYELKHFNPSDRVLIERNNLYVNGKFIRYIKPNKVIRPH